MNSLYLPETAGQVAGIFPESGDAVFPLTEEALLALQIEQKEHLNLEEVYDHAKFWDQYNDSLQLCSRVNEGSVEVAKKTRHKFLGDWIALCFFQQKIAVDSYRYKYFILEALIKRLKPKRIVCSELKEIKLDKHALPESTFSMVPYVIDDLIGKLGEVNVSYLNFDGVRAQRFNFGQVFSTTTNTLRQISRLFLLGLYKERRIIFSNSPEIEEMEKHLIRRGVRVVNPFLEDGLVRFIGKFTSIETSSFKQEMIDRVPALNEHNALLDLLFLQYQSIAATGKVISAVVPFCRRILNRFDAKIVMNTAATFESLTGAILIASQESSCSRYCWMHGGYGAYASLPGFDVTDFRIIDKHIVYGRGVAESADFSLRKLKVTKDRQCEFIAGGSRHGSRKQKEASCSQKQPKIIFTLQCHWPINKYYYGYDRPYDFFGFCRENLRIIDLLAEYADRYEIILKDYPDSNTKLETNLYKQHIENQSKGKITYISNEMPYKKVIEDSDLNIFTWVSTTFIEALSCDGDMALIDTSAFCPAAKDVIERSIIFSNEVTNGIRRLEGYLDRGEFQIQDRSEMQEYFMEGNPSAVVEELCA